MNELEWRSSIGTHRAEEGCQTKLRTHNALLPYVLEKPWFHSIFHQPSLTAVSRRLVIGAALFGIGWGLSGFCPGPGVVSLFSGNIASLNFVFFMILGMILHRYIWSKKVVD